MTTPLTAAAQSTQWQSKSTAAFPSADNASLWSNTRTGRPENWNVPASIVGSVAGSGPVGSANALQATAAITESTPLENAGNLQHGKASSSRRRTSRSQRHQPTFPYASAMARQEKKGGSCANESTPGIAGIAYERPDSKTSLTKLSLTTSAGPSSYPASSPPVLSRDTESMLMSPGDTSSSTAEGTDDTKWADLVQLATQADNGDYLLRLWPDPYTITYSDPEPSGASTGPTVFNFGKDDVYNALQKKGLATPGREVWYRTFRSAGQNYIAPNYEIKRWSCLDFLQNRIDAQIEPKDVVRELRPFTYYSMARAESYEYRQFQVNGVNAWKFSVIVPGHSVTTTMFDETGLSHNTVTWQLYHQPTNHVFEAGNMRWEIRPVNRE